MKPGQIFAHWRQIRQELLWTIDQFSDGELSHVPFESAWSVGEIILHIASAEEGWFRYVVQGKLPGWPEYELEKNRNRESIKKLLGEVHKETEIFLDTMEEADLKRAIDLPWSEGSRPMTWIIWHVLEHEIHHRGELSLILGLLGREGLDV